MTTCTSNCLMSVINIGNSIIGVSILAMPYCFRKCGILLSVVLIFVSGLLTRIACYLLLKSAIMARRRNFEILAFHTFGSTGKLAVEMSVIGFLIGVCIAFFVVIGDLGPPLAAEFLGIENSPHLRTNVLMLVGLCVALPLGMLRKIDSLTSLSALSIAFYACLILKVFAEAVPNLAANEWWYEVNWWQSDGILPCLPIFSMALSCQTQLFEFFDTLNDPSLKRMQTVISGAVHLCSSVYIMVGAFGYIAFHDKVITGNALILFPSSPITQIMKLGFILTVAVSFPLCLFPCRSSLHSLLFKQGFGHHDINVNIIPDHRFRLLTISLVIITIGVAIMLPNIEFVLSIIGSTIGTLICLIFPAVMFIHDTSKNTTEKRLAQLLMSIGAFILIACTYSTLREASLQPEPVTDPLPFLKVTPQPALHETSAIPSLIAAENTPKLFEKEKNLSPVADMPSGQKRQEPPIPQEPDTKVENSINADLDPQALQKEDKELQKDLSVAAGAKETKELDKQEELLQKLEEQHEEQKQLLKEQKEVLEELKRHKESHEEQRLVEVAQNKETGAVAIAEKPAEKAETGKHKTIKKPSLVADGSQENGQHVPATATSDKRIESPMRNRTFEADPARASDNEHRVKPPNTDAPKAPDAVPTQKSKLVESKVNKTHVVRKHEQLHKSPRNISTSILTPEVGINNWQHPSKMPEFPETTNIAHKIENPDFPLKQKERKIEVPVLLPKEDLVKKVNVVS